MPFKGFIFDFDGLILDTETPLYDAWQEIFQDYGASLPLEKYAACIGADFNVFDPAIYLSEITSQSLDRDEAHKRANALSLELLKQRPLRPGIQELIDLSKSAGIKLAVASSSGRKWVVPNLVERNLYEYFDVIRTGSDVSRVKPFPDLYQSALAGLGLCPSECIAFEDSHNGVTAACQAGLICCAIPNQVTRFMDFSQAALVLESLDNVTPDMLCSWLNG